MSNNSNVRIRRGRRAGFSLVELALAVLMLAMLAVVAVPRYASQNKASAARACKANLAALAVGESTYASLNGFYGSAAGLAGVCPKSLPVCPLDHAEYTGFATTDHQRSGITITCPNAAAHAAAIGNPDDFKCEMPALSNESF